MVLIHFCMYLCNMAFPPRHLSRDYFRMALNFFLLLETLCLSPYPSENSLRRDGNTSQGSACVRIHYYKPPPCYTNWSEVDNRHRHPCCYNVNHQSDSAPVRSAVESHDGNAWDFASNQHWNSSMVWQNGRR